jgi:alkylation response protein AidB-like acyl-CoA dehydrogenase
MPTNRFAEVQHAVAVIAREFAETRSERIRRRQLAPEDFARLAAAGWLLTGVPEADGGLWTGLRTSVRNYAELVRTLAVGDPCVALVAAMHPSVLAFWLAVDTPPTSAAQWQAQRADNFASAAAGHWWGTLISEPGSGGDLLKTRTQAQPVDSGYVLSGEKHFGSGSGITSFMITTARPDGATSPDLFVLDMRGRAWDGSTGLTLLRPWDGHGMIATQSHAFTLARCPAVRAASHDAIGLASPAVSQLTPVMFAAVIVAIVGNAIELARARLRSRRDDLRAFERVTWVRVTNNAWLIEQAYAGALHAVETGSGGLLAAARAKTTIAELAEQCLSDLGRVLGGATYAHDAPFGQWAEDVRALGFLRPPWGLAFDQLYRMDLD